MSGNSESLANLAKALGAFLGELHSQYITCVAAEKTAAFHERGMLPQIYKLYASTEQVAASVRKMADVLPSWEQAPLWTFESDEWQKAKQQVLQRMKRHKGLLEVVTQGVCWKGRAILVHAYKFETDPVLKVELILPDTHVRKPEFALRATAEALECHDFLVPQIVAEALPPYSRHEAKFSTISEYLRKNLPSDMSKLLFWE